MEPGKTIKINIRVGQEFNYNRGFGALSLAHHCVSLALDVTPINTFEIKNGAPVGISSSVANPTNYKIGFNTNGTMTPQNIVKVVCDNIIERVKAVEGLLYAIEENNDEHILVIDGETDTIGNLFMRTISDIYPDITAVTYSTSNVGRSITIKIRCDEDISTIYDGAIRHITGVFEQIKKQI